MDEVKFTQEYLRLCHAIQTGIVHIIDSGGNLAEPKHLRTGIDITKCEQGALAELLMDKGLITKEEYQEKILKYLRLEVEVTEELLSKVSGVKITLA